MYVNIFGPDFLAIWHSTDALWARDKVA